VEKYGIAGQTRDGNIMRPLDLHGPHLGPQTHTHTDTHTNRHTHTDTHTHRHTHTQTHTHRHTQTHRHRHTDTDTHTHTQNIYTQDNLYRCSLHLDINVYVHQLMHLFISSREH